MRLTIGNNLQGWVRETVFTVKTLRAGIDKTRRGSTKNETYKRKRQRAVKKKKLNEIQLGGKNDRAFETRAECSRRELRLGTRCERDRRWQRGIPLSSGLIRRSVCSTIPQSHGGRPTSEGRARVSVGVVRDAAIPLRDARRALHSTRPRIRRRRHRRQTASPRPRCSYTAAATVVAF